MRFFRLPRRKKFDSCRIVDITTLTIIISRHSAQDDGLKEKCGGAALFLSNVWAICELPASKKQQRQEHSPLRVILSGVEPEDEGAKRIHPRASE